MKIFQKRIFGKTAITLILSMLLSLFASVNVSYGSVSSNPSSYQTTIGTPVTIKGVVNDASGNPIASTNISVTSDTPDVPGQTINTNSQGSFFLTYTPKAAGADHITFAINSATSTATVNVLQGNPQSISLQSSTGSTYSSAPITLTAGQTLNLKGNVAGPYGSPIAGANVVVASPTDGTDNFMPNGAITTDATGNFTDSGITMTLTGTQYIQATTGGVSSPAQVQVNVQSAAPNQVLNLQANPQQIGAGSTVTVTGTLQDQYGNPVSNANLSLVGPDATTPFTTQAGGLFSVAQKITTPGMATLKIQYSGSTLSGGTVSVNVLPTGSYNLSVDLSAAQITAGNALTAKITLKDNTGATVSGKTLTLSESPTSSALSQTAVTTDSNGQAIVTVGPVTKAGYENLTATMDGVSNVIGTATFQVVPAAPAQVYSSVSPTTAQVNTNVMVFGTLTDSFANPVNGANLTVSGGFGSNISGTTNANGYFSISLVPTNVGGPFVLNYSVNSSLGTFSANQNTLTVIAPIVIPTSKVLEGTIIAGQTGTMPNMSTRNPNGIGVGKSQALTFSTGGATLYIKPQQGFYDGINTWTYYTDPNLIPGNIKSGTSIFGVTGTYSATPSHGSQSWTTPGTYTWTVPDGVNRVLVGIYGAGGAGGPSGYNGNGTGGGGGGAFGGASVNVTPGQQITVVVGVGGTTSDGGNSSFGSLTVDGGKAGGYNHTPGAGGAAPTTGFLIGFPGGQGGSDFNWSSTGSGGGGSAGSSGDGTTASFQSGGSGGPAIPGSLLGPSGGTGGKGSSDCSKQASAGSFPGGGGGGDAGNDARSYRFNGGPGADGAVYASW
ncbi:beta strand repeat-containing protein [Desulfitobacterium sp. AusDCA]|uniref:beta strand repeat-containing protein n=1 Tax=Desulfitobacterium sp. AusDCA TaxID=3240383 RepID=UPI003DA746E6